MAAKNSPAAPGEFVVTRTLDAPRDVVWSAWTEPARLERWWGPKGLGLRVVKLDFRPGGLFHYAMVHPNGTENYGRFVYREIVRPERIVFLSGFADAAGEPVHAPFAQTWPLEMLNVLTLEERGGKTTLTLRATAHNATAAERKTFEEGFKSMEGGFGGTFDKLAEFLRSA